MKIKVKVVRDGGEEVVTITPLAVLGWEKATGRRMSDMGKTGLGMGDMAIMAMTQERLEGKTTETDEAKWLVGVDELGPEDDEPGAPPVAPSDPTEEGPSDGP